MSFGGKVALITGAQQGIGKAMVKAFAEAGSDVAINWLDDRTAANQIATEARSFGVQAELIQGDISNPNDAYKIVNHTIEALNSIDFLINNAGVFPRVPFLKMKEEDWDYVINVNLKGSFFCAQAAVKSMIKAKHSGCIINLASQAIRGNAPNSIHYTASKSGIVGMTRAMALEVAPHNIRVNSIAPGLTDTAQPRYGNSEEEISEMSQEIPLKRIIQPEEIADMAIFLSSEKARMVTGQTYHVNGGTYSPG